MHRQQEAIGNAATRPSVRLSVSHMPLTQKKRCVLGPRLLKTLIRNPMQTVGRPSPRARRAVVVLATSVD